VTDHAVTRTLHYNIWLYRLRPTPYGPPTGVILIQHRHAQRPAAARSRIGRLLPSRAPPLRHWTALLTALAFIFQLTLVERHFEPLFPKSALTEFSASKSVAPANALSPANSEANAKSLTSRGERPLGPSTGQPDDDCPLCQFLALGTATDFPHDAIALLRAAPAVATPPPADHAQPRQHARGAHQPRAPPSPTIA
jgi:hypothetical protein